MRDRDLAEYLEHGPFLEYPLQGSGDPSPPVGRVLEEPKPKRAAETERAKFASDILHMVMSVFTGARWTTREEYKRASALRDRKGRNTRG